MDSIYKPASVEPKWSRIWLERKTFHGAPNPKKPSFSMVIPPPNITGSLHMGHALNATIQDILNRWKRMQGYETCWFPGTDHAGIATQVVVERELRRGEGKTRFDLGREQFIARVWEWKKQYGGVIDEQLRELGVSCDWDRYSFTMDEKPSRAVIEAFVRLHKKGIIYRDRYIVNWCPKCQTALSDLEVEHPENETLSVLYYFNYPLEDNPKEYITIATVRPETILADVAIAVSPGDERYKKFVGRNAILPLIGRKLKIIADEWADPKVGTGAVKITPAHDPNDFEVGRRHQLTPIQIIDPQGRMSLGAIWAESQDEKIKAWLHSNEEKDRFDFREEMVRVLKEESRYVKEEPWPSNPGRCARSGDIIEPYLSVQWFARMKDFAAPAIQAVKTGKTQFHPERFSKIYFDWMENIRDWCVSRQLWWGHRIPAWYCLECDKKNILKSGFSVTSSPPGKPFPIELESHYIILEGAKPIVRREKPAACPVCKKNDLIQDPDVLDTWFSSGLWPLSTMGWPEETEELKTYYPTSVLSTGRDIIFLWVARMMMTGLEFKGEVPFHHVYIHPTILDREGKRMSKSKGTGVDPLRLIAKYGADATRFGMILMCQGQDVRFNEEKIEQARNFANKIWNAARFVLSSLQGLGAEFQHRKFSESNLTFYDRWILLKLSALIGSVTRLLEEYEFGTAASQLYDFVWDDFCDWYLELSKLGLQGNAEERKGLAAVILAHVLSGALKLLHPFMPFLTEEIWDQLSAKPTLLIDQSWPAEELPAESEPVMESFIETVKGVRNLRAEIGLKPHDRPPLVIRTDHQELFEKMKSELIFLARASSLRVIDEKQTSPRKALSVRVAEGSVYVPLEGLLDIGAELGRLKTEQDKNMRELENVKKLLGDPSFSGKAKPEVVEKTKEKEKLLRQKLERVKDRFEMLSS